jgi:photosystem II stability/assembly factor-like uncharacterized protein
MEVVVSDRSNRQETTDYFRIKIPDDLSNGVLTFAENGSLIVAGSGYLLISHDSGVSWSRITGGDGDTAFVDMNSGRLRQTPARTKKWINTSDLCDVESMVATGGRLFISSICEHHVEIWSVPIIDTTASWHRRIFPTENQSLEVDAEIQSGYSQILVNGFVNGNSALLSTDNFGDTWRFSWIGTETSRMIFQFLDRMNGYAILGDGKVLNSTDGGKTWLTFSTLPSGMAGNIASMTFENKSTGWVVGSGGTIAKTNDGGRTWERQKSNAQSSLSSVAAASEYTAWIGGENGTILKTIDGGLNWMQLDIDFGSSAGVYSNDIRNIQLHDNKAWTVIGHYIYVLS